MNSQYTRHYKRGYEFGMDPRFHRVEDIPNVTSYISSTYAFQKGFEFSRIEYELLNGPLTHQLPDEVLTLAFLREVEIEAELGMELFALGFTEYQLTHILHWHQRGLQKHDASATRRLQKTLSKLGIRL